MLFEPFLLPEKVADSGCGVGLGAGTVEEVEGLEEGKVCSDSLETSD